MPNNYFKFKRFTIYHQNSAMRVGTDGVMLGAWAPLEAAGRILDVGTGTGLIAIMLAQRSLATIDAVEIDEPSAAQARDNALRCPWSQRVSVFHESFQLFSGRVGREYDLIVSNPPYFINSLKSPLLARTVARHTQLLTHSELIGGITKLLKPNGSFAGIFPYVEGNLFIALAAGYGLHCVQKLNVLPKPGKPVSRVLLEFRFERAAITEGTIAIRNELDGYTENYRKLTKDFYLAF